MIFWRFVITICLNVKSQRTKEIKVFSQGTDDFKNLRCETLYIGDYEYVNISSFAVLGIKLWLGFIFQNLKVVGPLGGKVDIFSPSGFEIQSDFDNKTSKIKFYSVKALKCYLNEKNLMHGRVTAMISKFSP